MPLWFNAVKLYPNVVGVSWYKLAKLSYPMNTFYVKCCEKWTPMLSKYTLIFRVMFAVLSTLSVDGGLSIIFIVLGKTLDLI